MSLSKCLGRTGVNHSTRPEKHLAQEPQLMQAGSFLKLRCHALTQSEWFPGSGRSGVVVTTVAMPSTTSGRAIDLWMENAMTVDAKKLFFSWDPFGGCVESMCIFSCLCHLFLYMHFSDGFTKKKTLSQCRNGYIWYLSLCLFAWNKSITLPFP